MPREAGATRSLPDYLARQTEVRPWREGFSAVDLGGAQIDGNVYIEAVRFCANVELRNVTVGGSTAFTGFEWAGAEEHGFAFVAPTRIAGGLMLSLSKLKRPAYFGGVRVDDDLLMWGMRTHFVRMEPFRSEPCTIGGSLDLHGARMRQFQMYGTQVVGRLRLSGCDIGEFAARPGRLTNPEPKQASVDGWQVNDSIVLSQVGQFLMRNAVIRGDLELEYLQVTGREVDGERGVVISNSTIDGSLVLFGEEAIVRTYLSPQRTYAEAKDQCKIDYREFSAAVIGGVRIKRSRIGAALNLSAVKVEGCIDLEDSHIGHPDFSAVQRHTPCVSSPEVGPLSAHNRAVCMGLNLRMLQCDNDVDLSGLTVIIGEGIVGADGGIDGRFLTVEGDLECVSRTNLLPSGQKLAAFAQVEGDIDFSYAKLTHLEISGCSFEPCASAGHSVGGELVLERARVGKLEVKEVPQSSRPSGHATRGQDYPPLRLIDVDVEVWDIEGSEPRNAGAAKYVNLLANDRMPAEGPFR